MNRIAQLRKEKDWSQQELADMLEVHQTAVSQWENERTTPNFEALMELCGLFDVRPEYLMGNSNERGHFNPTEEEMDGRGGHTQGLRFQPAPVLCGTQSGREKESGGVPGYSGRECRFQSIASRLIHRNLLY